MSGSTAFENGPSLEGAHPGESFTASHRTSPQVRYADDPEIGEAGSVHRETHPQQDRPVRVDQARPDLAQEPEEDAACDAAPRNSRLYLVLVEDLDYLTNDKGTYTNNSPDGRPSGNDSGNAPKQPNPDFTDGANDLWSLYLSEAHKHDTARIQTLKDDMDGVLLYVRQNV
jgi:hypothetical protein